MGLIGLIADTHGLVRPRALEALRGVELILHAGDVGEGVLAELQAVAPVQAVRGNTDPVDDASLPVSLMLDHGGLTVFVTHGHELGVPTPAELLATYAGDVLVYGHTHRKVLHAADGRWVVNPGAAGPRRFDARPSVARMTIAGRDVRVEFVEL
jgi:hypothetical protein